MGSPELSWKFLVMVVEIVETEKGGREWMVRVGCV